MGRLRTAPAPSTNNAQESSHIAVVQSSGIPPPNRRPDALDFFSESLAEETEQLGGYDSVSAANATDPNMYELVLTRPQTDSQRRETSNNCVICASPRSAVQ